MSKNRKIKCPQCLKRSANQWDEHQGTKVRVCKRCLQQNEIERSHNKALLTVAIHLKDKDYVTARRQLGTITKKMAKDKPIYIKQWLERQRLDWLAILYFQNADYFEAIKILHKRRKRVWDSGYSKLTMHLVLGDAYFRAGNSAKALEVLKSCLDIGVREKQASALSALEMLYEYFGENLEYNPKYARAIANLCGIKNIEIPREYTSIKNTEDLAKAISWISSVKKQWY